MYFYRGNLGDENTATGTQGTHGDLPNDANDDSSISGGKNSTMVKAAGAGPSGNAVKPTPQPPKLVTSEPISPSTAPPAAWSTASEPQPPSTSAERMLPTPMKPKPTSFKPASLPKPTAPKPTMHKPTAPKPTKPQPTKPQPTTPKPSTPMLTTLMTTTPKPTKPTPTTPTPRTPRPTTPTPRTPRPTTPTPRTPRPTTPTPRTPRPTTPTPRTPRPTTPTPRTPRPTRPSPTTPKPSKPKVTTPKPTMPMPSSPKPPTTKPSGDSSEPRERQRMSGESLICTVSVVGQNKLGIPKDGLCNFLFYDSLYRPQGDTLMKEPRSQLVKFLSTAAISKDTDHGFSVDIDNVRAFSDHLLEQKGKKRIKEMGDQKVIDYGFLTLDHSRSSRQNIQEALSALKAVTQIVKEVTGKTGVTVLGLYSKVNATCQTILDISGQEFKPSAIVILGHISYYDRHVHGCRILPPNLYGVHRDVLKDIGYGHLFEDGVALARCIEDKIKFTSKIPVKVSVTLKGRRYKAKPEGDPSFVGIGNFDLLRECGRPKRDPQYQQDAPAVRVCGESEQYKRNINFSEQYQSVVTYDKLKGFTITFDNEASLRKKVCDARASHGSFSLAAYDVNYDQGKSVCDMWGPKGHLSRLKLIRKLNAFMRGEDAGDKVICKSDSDNLR
ncbi:uncharacterized protein [Dermacentor albipictus]|uniref:uncharacterized protein isoform X2 n=1 Tax=Dermacentor albipictus TaxID=60249 RepID=UPI0038FC8221